MGRYPALEQWLTGQRTADLALAAITLGELRYGVARLAPGRQRTELATWLETQLPPQFAGRILPLDHWVADAWGQLRAAGESIGRPLPILDGLLLATAQVHTLTFVTRNDRALTDRGVGVINPYQ